jgi:RHS repeat-associated protein
MMSLNQYNNYYPFGMLMPGRHGSDSEGYRYGFQGQEKDDEVSGEGNSYTAEFWKYDSRLGRRWNVDPVIKTHESPYAAFANNPIWFTDPNGADSIKVGDEWKWQLEKGDTYYDIGQRTGQDYEALVDMNHRNYPTRELHKHTGSIINLEYYDFTKAPSGQGGTTTSSSAQNSTSDKLTSDKSGFDGKSAGLLVVGTAGEVISKSTAQIKNFGVKNLGKMTGGAVFLYTFTEDVGGYYNFLNNNKGAGVYSIDHDEFGANTISGGAGLFGGPLGLWLNLTNEAGKNAKSFGVENMIDDLDSECDDCLPIFGDD